MTDRTRQHETDGIGRVGSLVGSPWVLGGLLTVGFYALIDAIPFQHHLLERYFASHPLEYATTALFFVGMAALGIRWFRLPLERRILLDDPLAQEWPHLHQLSDPETVAVRLQQRLADLPSRYASTHWIRRVRDAVEALSTGASENEEYLHYLADLSADRSHRSLALVRTVTWAVPILGFLGTVIGITMAIANIQPEQIEQSFDNVIAGLAVAFDTTTLALALSLVLVFSTFSVERSEQRILDEVEEKARRRLGPLFTARKAGTGDPLQAEQVAAARILEATEALISRHTAAWDEVLESLRDRWSETLKEREQRFCDVLDRGMNAALDAHEHRLRTAEESLLGAVQQAAAEVGRQLSESAQAVVTEHRQLVERMAERGAEWRNTAAALLDQQREVQSDWQAGLAASASAWRENAEQIIQTMQSHADEQAARWAQLQQVIEAEEGLARTQERLAENLQVVQVAESLDRTLHELTAAVHLLTARAKPRAA